MRELEGAFNEVCRVNDGKKESVKVRREGRGTREELTEEGLLFGQRNPGEISGVKTRPSSFLPFDMFSREGGTEGERRREEMEPPLGSALQIGQIMP